MLPPFKFTFDHAPIKMVAKVVKDASIFRWIATIIVVFHFYWVIAFWTIGWNLKANNLGINPMIDPNAFFHPIRLSIDA
jgi:hypothetical protein